MNLVNRVEACDSLHLCGDDFTKDCSFGFSLVVRVAFADGLSITADEEGINPYKRCCDVPSLVTFGKCCVLC